MHRVGVVYFFNEGKRNRCSVEYDLTGRIPDCAGNDRTSNKGSLGPLVALVALRPLATRDTLASVNPRAALWALRSGVLSLWTQVALIALEALISLVTLIALNALVSLNAFDALVSLIALASLLSLISLATLSSLNAF